MATAKKDAKLVGGLWLLISPSALLIATILLYAIVNFVAGGTNTTVAAVFNIFLYLLGVIGVITWLPGIVIGIVLLATRK